MKKCPTNILFSIIYINKQNIRKIGQFALKILRLGLCILYRLIMPTITYSYMQSESIIFSLRQFIKKRVYLRRNCLRPLYQCDISTALDLVQWHYCEWNKQTLFTSTFVNSQIKIHLYPQRWFLCCWTNYKFKRWYCLWIWIVNCKTK